MFFSSYSKRFYTLNSVFLIPFTDIFSSTIFLFDSPIHSLQNHLLLSKYPYTHPCFKLSSTCPLTSEHAFWRSCIRGIQLGNWDRPKSVPIHLWVLEWEDGMCIYSTYLGVSKIVPFHIYSRFMKFSGYISLVIFHYVRCYSWLKTMWF